MIRIRRVWASAFLAVATLPVAAGIAQASPVESAESAEKPIATQEAQQPEATDSSEQGLSEQGMATGLDVTQQILQNPLGFLGGAIDAGGLDSLGSLGGAV